MTYRNPYAPVVYLTKSDLEKLPYRVDRAEGYEPWGVTVPFVWANYGQPQRLRGQVSPMIFQTDHQYLLNHHLGGLGGLAAIPALRAVRSAARVFRRHPAARHALLSAHDTRYAAIGRTRPGLAPHDARYAAMDRMRRERLALPATLMPYSRMVGATTQASRMAAAAADSGARGARTSAVQLRQESNRHAATMMSSMAGMGQATAPTALLTNGHVTTQSVLDEELARSRRMEIVSVASLILGVASYILFRQAVAERKAPITKNRRNRRTKSRRRK